MRHTARKAGHRHCLAALASNDLLPKERSEAATSETWILKPPPITVSVQQADGVGIEDGARYRNQSTVVSPIAQTRPKQCQRMSLA